MQKKSLGVWVDFYGGLGNSFDKCYSQRCYFFMYLLLSALQRTSSYSDLHSHSRTKAKLIRLMWLSIRPSFRFTLRIDLNCHFFMYLLLSALQRKLSYSELYFHSRTKARSIKLMWPSIRPSLRFTLRINSWCYFFMYALQGTSYSDLHSHSKTKAKSISLL